MSGLGINMNGEIRIWQENLFARSIRRRRKLDALRTLVGNTTAMHALEINLGDGAISSGLRELGGSWKTAVPSQTAAESVGYFLKESISLVAEGRLPFDDGTFDRVVIVDALKYFRNDGIFIRECHRVLKNDGWVIISERRRLGFGPVALLHRLFKTTPMARGAFRNGYRISDLFNILKDGFDVPVSQSCSNGLLEMFCAVGEAAQKSLFHDYYWLVGGKVEKDILFRYRRLRELTNIAYPFAWILSKLEFLPCHQFLVKSRRRPWRPRLQPKLIDGRSIAEAAINTKIGTAAPF